MDYDKFQNAVGKWSRYNFGKNVKRKYQPLLGIVEEVCDEVIYSALINKDSLVIDAIGDTMIYLTDYCCSHKISLSHLMDNIKLVAIQRNEGSHGLLLLAVTVGRLCHNHLKLEQKIRSNEDLAKKLEVQLCSIILQLIYLAKEYGSTLDACMLLAWDEVKNRDWKKYPNNGKTE